MSSTSSTEKSHTMGLGEFLKTLRTTKNLSLRAVEEATDHAVSNPYLSQLEKGKIQKPSPNILHALAEVYNVAYEVLMEKAGYISAQTSTRSEPGRHGRLATLSRADLTNDEEEELFRYLGYLRSQRGTAQDEKK